MKRVFLMVLDSVGIGAMPDAAEYGDEGSNTLKSASESAGFSLPNMERLGLFQIDGVCVAGREASAGEGSKAVAGQAEAFQGAVARMAEKSKGKDTTIGHWEIAGMVSKRPLPTFPDGFPEELLDALRKETGRELLCNKPYSGTEVIKDYGEEHVRTGALIVYTSADSVLQIAAHESVVPVEELYRFCEIARRLCTGKYGVGRVIARPFEGEWPYKRTSRRHDYSLEPPGKTMLNHIQEAGLDVLAVGKINDIFAGSGITESVRTTSNQDGIDKTLGYAGRDFHGLCFTNLVDYDMLYGHRNDVEGYARALTYFDERLPELVSMLEEEDILMLTADHGCDPATESTDHSREYTPLVVVGKPVKEGVNLGTRESFADIAATILEYLGVEGKTDGTSFLEEICSGAASRRKEAAGAAGGLTREEKAGLIRAAFAALPRAYAPSSQFQVAAALLCADGTVYTGVNVENASYPAGNCAERTAMFKAVSEGRRKFRAIAICGGRQGMVSDYCAPCGICRQVMREFVRPEDFVILLPKSETDYKEFTLGELLPLSFGPESLV